MAYETATTGKRALASSVMDNEGCYLGLCVIL